MPKVRCEDCRRKIKTGATQRSGSPEIKTTTRRATFAVTCVLSAVFGGVLAYFVLPYARQTQPVREVEQRAVTLGMLLDTPPQELAKYDVAVMNLACAEGLPGAEGLDKASCLKTLDNWTRQIKRATEERHFVYDKDPAKFDNSEHWWRAACIVSYLNSIIGTKYDPDLKRLPPPTHKFDTNFFADSRDVLLHGLLGGKRAGTCSSMPVLIVSVGRRLGYPLKLVRTNRHLFARWDDPKTGERFNIEGTDKYPEKKPDSFYMGWPEPVSKAEATRCGLLTSMTPAQEFATFLGFRGLCLWHSGRRAEAQLAFSMSHCFDPRNPRTPQYITQILDEEWVNGLANGYENVPPPPQ